MNSSEPTANSVFTSGASMKAGPRDVFLHLLAIFTLYLSAVAFGTLLFHFVDLAFPDPFSGSFSEPRGPIRWAVSALVIIFPAYLWLSWRLAKDATVIPEKREMRIRKWLLYFTLSAAAAVILGDLVALVYNFLSGGLSAAFILKILSIVFIAAAVFGYYLWNLRAHVMASRDPRMRIFVFGMIAIVAAGTVAGFFVAGSPFAERARRFDERRVGNLQELQWQIVNYWQRKESLPTTLDDLRDPISGFVPSVDPETGASYEYHALGPLSFELCAAFKTVSDKSDQRYLMPAYPKAISQDTWFHEAGRACFSRTIDPELYPPLREPKR